MVWREGNFGHMICYVGEYTIQVGEARYTIWTDTDEQLNFLIFSSGDSLVGFEENKRLALEKLAEIQSKRGSDMESVLQKV